MSEQAPKHSAAHAAQRFIFLLIIVALGAVVLWLLSERHARTYAVEEHDGELEIERGRELPGGFTPYRPADKLLAQAYANIPMHGDSPGELVVAPFDDRDQLDQAIFRTLKGWIESRLDADDSERLTQAIKLLRRIELLTGISAEQRAQLKELQGKAAYVEGRARLDEAEVALRDAVQKLRLAADSRGRYSRDAGEMFERLNGLSEQLSHAVRATRAAEPEPKKPLPAEKDAAVVPAAPAPESLDAATAAAPVPAVVPVAAATRDGGP